MSLNKVEILKPITLLVGEWKGRGHAIFPTHKEYRFENSMKFGIIEDAFDKEPLVHFEEAAWILEGSNKEFIHSETGYFKPEEDGGIQLYVCHNTGRMEVTYCESSEFDKMSFEIEFVSDFIRNDAGTKETLASVRKFKYQNNRLTYTLNMSTKEVRNMTHHVKAEMERKS